MYYNYNTSMSIMQTRSERQRRWQTVSIQPTLTWEILLQHSLHALMSYFLHSFTEQVDSHIFGHANMTWCHSCAQVACLAQVGPFPSCVKCHVVPGCIAYTVYRVIAQFIRCCIIAFLTFHFRSVLHLAPCLLYSWRQVRQPVAW